MLEMMAFDSAKFVCGADDLKSRILENGDRLSTRIEPVLKEISDLITSMTPVRCFI